ncbi:sigma 54-interacting transcriptional regulator [Enorma phocaeensis]|uniref:sigma 54-interacting transcriptional regulator n=1 Tax=Enorma phocaeensis TaxID=1871019 RepID=UPI0023563EA1|nr:sigma 54-interacting transcriptional regulator [Enorma phocaeensis]
MSIPETQKDVLAYLDGITREIDRSRLDRFTTASIASALAVSRNLASQYLNDLVRADLAVKAGSKPVYYFHRRDLERYMQVGLDRSTFSSLDSLFSQSKPAAPDFERAIGSELSLSACIDQIRAAMVYPPCGIPVLLLGQYGTGKSLFAELAFEYGVHQEIIPASSRFVRIECSHYREDAVRLVDELFGDGENDGLLAAGDIGLLYLKDIDQLPVSMREVIVSRLCPEGIRANQADGAHGVRVFFSMAGERDSAEARELIRRLPIMVYLPPLRDRTPEEREELILHFLKLEGRRMGTDVFISKGAFHRLAEADYDENVRGMRAAITACCAEAFLRLEGDRLQIRTYQLPDEIIDGAPVTHDDEDLQLIDVTRTAAVQGSERELRLLSPMIETWDLYCAGSITSDELASRIMRSTRDYEDYLVFEDQRLLARSGAYGHVVDEIIDGVNSLYSINLTKKSALVVTREVCSQIWPSMQLARWKAEYASDLAALFSTVFPHQEFCSSVADRISMELMRTLGIELDALTRLLIAAHVDAAQVEPGSRRRLGIILAHGYSTATSLADAANRLLGTRVFEAIDMPYDQQVRDVIGKLQQIIDHFSFCDELAILVDTGSLRDIYKDLQAFSDKTIGIVNNVSTGLALEVGVGLIAGRSLDEVLENAVSSCVCSYRLVERSVRQDAIVFCAEGGIEAAEKIKELISQSLDPAADVRLVARDFRQLVDNGINDSVFSRFAVRAVIGTSNPQLVGVPYIALEDLIAGRSDVQVDRVFSRYLDPEGLGAFRRNLVKNLTLRNVVESITILNPSKLYSEIERAVGTLRLLTGAPIESRMIGLYVHLCCLVERLVTRTPIESCDDETFERDHADFIEAFRESFADISAHYHVEVPVAEIVYAYDYIYPQHALRKRAYPMNGSVGQEDE